MDNSLNGDILTQNLGKNIYLTVFDINMLFIYTIYGMHFKSNSYAF